VPIYKKLGRDKFIEHIQQDGISLEEAKEIIKNGKKEKAKAL
jgi:DNA-binding transcriptional regulator YhcF (GntR family)